MVTNKSKIVYLGVLIIFLAVIAIYTADWVGVIKIGDYVPFMSEAPELLDVKHEPKDEIEKLELIKIRQKLDEDRENIIRQSLILKNKEENLNRIEDELAELKTNLDNQKEKLELMAKDIDDRNARIKKVAANISSMPPDDSVKILLALNDYEIIAVLKQMDENAANQGEDTITPFLLTLINKAESGRAGDITRKMLINPKISRFEY